MTSRTAPTPVELVLAVVARAQMNIVGAAGTFGEGQSLTEIDFGVVGGTSSRRVFLQVRANSAARLTIDSANKGRLVRVDGLAREVGIPYFALFKDEPIDLTRHWERVIEPPRSIAGASLPLDLAMDSTGAHVAGTYTDVLTVELSAI